MSLGFVNWRSAADSPSDSWGEWIERQSDLTWYPLRGTTKTFPDVPEHIAAAASEAHECQSIDGHRAAVLMARSVIEATAKAKGIVTGTLYGKIEALETRGLIRPHIKDAAHEVRHLGNDMAHGDFVDPIESDDAEAVLVLMGEILLEVFQSPARVARLKEQREAKANGTA